jgi:hypothetical protein
MAMKSKLRKPLIHIGICFLRLNGQKDEAEALFLTHKQQPEF